MVLEVDGCTWIQFKAVPMEGGSMKMSVRMSKESSKTVLFSTLVLATITVFYEDTLCHN